MLPTMVLAPRPTGFRSIAPVALAACAVLAGLGGCLEQENTVILPANYNKVRNRSVRIDASKFATKTGDAVDASQFKADKVIDYTWTCIGANCSEFKAVTTDGVKASSMMGVLGTAKAAIASDEAKAALFNQSVRSMYAFQMRIPVGYGCKPMMQGLFPDRTKNVDDIASYDFKAFDDLIGATRSVGANPVWTAGYDLGDAGQPCKYENGEVKGAPIKDIAKWVKAVRKIASWYDFELPAKNKNPQTGNALCLSTDKNLVKPWYCSPSLFNMEFIRDPFGAGGYTAANKADWLALYKAYADSMRELFFLPDNEVKIIGPSLVLKSDLELQDTSPTNPNRSPMYDFIDFVTNPANNQKNGQRLALSYLSMEIEASSPKEAQSMVKRVADYAALKGLKAEKGLSGEDGTHAIPIWVSDLRIRDVPAAVKPLTDPKSPSFDLDRYAAWRGGFLTATKMLWQGLVADGTIGSVVRFPTVDPTASDAITMAGTARESEYLWFGQAKIDPGALKPTGWPGFWFHPDHMGGKQLVAVKQGPDALGISGAEDSRADAGIVAMATRSSCVNVNREPVFCVPDASDSPGSVTYFTKGKKNILRALVTDFQDEILGDKEVLEHKLRVQVDGLPVDAKNAGYKLAWIDGTASTWSEILYREQGFVDITNGSLSFTRVSPVPSVLFVELYF